MSTFNIKEHAADEAGGEVILSSDGMDPLPSVRPPIKAGAATSADATLVGDLVDTAEGISMEDALESFHAQYLKGYASKATPRERLQRLQQELKQVEQDCAGEESLRKQVMVLHEQLQATWHRQTTASGRLHVLDEATKSKSNQSQTATVSLSDLEAKILRLERAIGSEDGTAASSGSGGKSSKALLDRLAQLEATMEVLDDAKLEAAARKAKVLRQDLEAASKARNKLMAPNRAEDSKTLTALYDNMMELSELSQNLPALTQRLQTLSHIHVDAATWASRLQAAEAACTRLNTQVVSVETSVQEVKDSWIQTSLVFQDNLKALDQRLANLPRS